jgi:WD40 repeat protein
VRGAVFSPDGKYVLTRSSDSTAKLWNGSRGALAAVLPHEGEVNGAIFSPDGTRMLTHSNNARLWDIKLLDEARGPLLRDRVCTDLMTGANVISAEDASEPILRGFEGTDVCAPGALSLRYWLDRAREATVFLGATARKTWGAVVASR